MSDASLAGEVPSYIEGKHSHYITNCGQVEVSTKTGKVFFACYGLGKNVGNIGLSVKIVNREFIVYRTYIGNSICEFLCSKDYPYKRGTTQMSIQQVLRILLLDEDNSQAGVYVKKELIRLMTQKLKFTLEDKTLLEELYMGWRTTISTKV